MAKAKSKIEIRNKKASYEYEFLENYTAGIVLTGTEIKSIRTGKASLVDSWCYFSGGELYVKNMHIAEYWWGTFNRHDPKRDRKLLLTRKELRNSSSQRPATPSSTSPSPAAKRNTTSASPSRKRTSAATQSTKPTGTPSVHKYTSENPPHLRWVPSLFGSQSFRRYTYVRTAMSRRCLLASISYG